jgi:antagonist of KipI
MLEVLLEGFMASLQGLANWAQQRWGLPPGGAMDEMALRAANALVGNPPDALALENGPGLLRLRCLNETCLAACGAGMSLWRNGQQLPLWTTCFVRAGDWLELRPDGTGCWGYLAVCGGFAHPVTVQMGQQLPVNRALTSAPLPGSSLRLEHRPAYTQSPRLGLLPGPHVDWLDEESHPALFHGSFTLSPTSNRMAYRLEGARLHLRRAADILSEGTVTGAVQLPGNGQPLILMAGRGATGGYALPAVVALVDLPLLTQCLPGAQVTFYPILLAEAQARWLAWLNGLQEGIQSPEEAALAWL